MNRKILFFPLFIAVFTTFVLAVTLTADMTEKVVVPAAYKTTVCKIDVVGVILLEDIIKRSDFTSYPASDCKELILGVAYVYAKEWTPEEPDATLIVFEMDGIVYRTTGMYFDKDSSDTELIVSGWSDFPNNIRVLSSVNADGTEDIVNGGYRTVFSADPPVQGLDFSTVKNLKGLIFKIDEEYYGLNETLVISSFIWYPETGIVE